MSEAYRVAGLPGDGIGPEVYPYANKLLEAGNQVLGREEVVMDEFPYGAQWYLDHGGKAWQDGEAERLADGYNAAFLVALGDDRIPKRGMAHARALILDGFRTHPRWMTNLNIRPATLIHPDLRPELLKGPFEFELMALDESDEQIDERVVDQGEITQTIYPREIHSLNAFKARLVAAARRAKELGENKILVALKDNVLEYSHGPWKDVCERIAADEGIEIERLLMDSLLDFLIKSPDKVPRVVVTDRAFGTVLSRAFEALKSDERQPIPEDFEVILARENTEGMYFRGGGSREEGDDKIGTQIGKHSRPMIEANIRGAIDLARQKGQNVLTVLHLEDAHPLSYGLWKEIATSMAESEGMSLNWMHAGDFVATLIQNPAVLNGQIFAADNVLGDICGDAAAALVGGLGIPPTDQVNTTGTTGKHFYEPLHGSAPKIAGKNIANPTASMLTIAELWKGRRLIDLTQGVNTALRQVLSAGIRTPDMKHGTATTQEYGDAVIQAFLQSTK